MIGKLAYTFSDDPVVLCAWLRRSHPYLEHHLDTFLSLFFFAKFVQPTLVLLVLYSAFDPSLKFASPFV